jgi:hypothetical protein
VNEELDTSAAVASYLGARKPEQVLHTSLTLAGAANPDAEAEFQRLSKAAGLPIDSVRDNAPAVKQRLAMPDTADLAAKFPSTTQYLSNIENARIAHDDVGSLIAIEKGIRSFMNGGGMKKEAGQALSFLGEGVKQIGLGATVGLGAGMFDLAAVPMDILSTATRGMLPQDIPGMLAADYRERAKRARAAMDEVSHKPEGNVAKGFQSGFRSAGQNLALLPLGIAAGTEAMLAGMVGMVGSQAYGDAREKGMAPLGALTYAIPQSVFEYAFEKLPASRLLEDIAKHSSLGTIVARQLGPEVLGEQATTVLQDLNEWVRLNPQKTAREFLEERPGAAMQTLVATLVGVGVQGGAVRGVQKVLGGAAEREASAQRAEASATRAQEFAGLVEQSKLRERDPQAFKQFVDQVAESGDAPTEFFIDAEQLANSLNQSAISLEELRAVAPQVAAQLEAAQHVPGADIRVPVAEFAAVPSDITTTLVDHLREAPDAMSRSEAQAFIKEQGDRIKQDVESALGDETKRAATKAATDAVRQHFEDQLNAVGKFRPEVNKAYATLMGSFYGTQAERAGMTADEFLQRYQLKVAKKDGAGSQRLEQAAPPAKPDPQKQRAMIDLRKRHKVLESLRTCLGAA